MLRLYITTHKFEVAIYFLPPELIKNSFGYGAKWQMQYKLRQNLKAQNATLPNQVNKAIQNPTIRWIFQIMEGINILQLWQDNVAKPIKQIITNLTGLRKKIIGLLSDTAWKMYGLIQENNSQVLGI